MENLHGKKLLIVGGGSGIARQLACDATAGGAEVILAGRGKRALDDSAAKLDGAVSTVRLDLGEEDSIRALASGIGELDYVVSLAAAHANGPVVGLERDAVAAAFDAKVIGPILLTKHLAPRIREGGSIMLFSGVAAWRPAPGLAVMATTNGAVDFLARALAVELAPIRVNALSPGIVDSGAWDAMGENRDRFFADTAAKNPARRIGRPADISSAALHALTNPFLTGTTLHVDGGGRLS
jgi:NAD(P)-dependent dehydrogenase (short-subunit alcohol dehydrogenase family)